MIKRSWGVAMVACALMSWPVAAHAVNVSSSDGSGVQYVTSWTSIGANLNGNLKSTVGRPVYYQGAATVVGGNTGYERYTKDVTSTDKYVGVGGWAGGVSVSKYTGVAVKVCRNVKALPDSCGKSVGIPRK